MVCSLSVCASYDNVYNRSARLARSLRLQGGAVLHTTPWVGINERGGSGVAIGGMLVVTLLFYE